MRKGKSYFYRFLVNFLITLIIPFLMILFMYIQTESTTRRQILMTEQRSLEQFANVFDTIAGEMQAACLSMTGSPECQKYASYAVAGSPKTTYQGVLTARAMDALMRDQYYDLFVYYPHEDRIVSGEFASVNARCYYDSYYCTYEERRSGLDYWEEFRSVLSSDSIRPTFHVMGPYLCMTMKQMRYSAPGMNFVAVVVLNRDMIGSLWEKGNAENTSSVVLFDGNGDFLLSGGGDFEDFRLEDTGRLGGAYPVRYRNTSYMTQVVRSGVTKNYFAYMIPKNYFWKQLTLLRLWCGLGCVACVAASLFIAYRSTQRTYRPVQDIVDELENESGVPYDKNEDSEFEFISRRFSEERSENNRLAENVRKGKEDRRERFLLSLLYGTVSPDAEDTGGRGGVPFVSDRFCVCAMEVRAKPDLETDMRHFILRNVFEELSGQTGRGWLVQTSEVSCALLCSLQEGVSEEDLLPVLARGQEFVKEHFDIEATMGVSEVQQGAERIASAYRQAREALNYWYLMGRGSLIRYGQIKDRTFRFEESSDSRVYRILSGYLQDADRAPSGTFVTELLEHFRIDESVSMETMESFRFEVMNALNTLLILGHCDIQTQREQLSLLLRSDTLEEFKRDLAMIMEELIRREEADPVLDICERAKQMVAADYSDPQLCVANLAERLNVTPNYLSRLFKRKYGVMLSDHISMTRVAKARELLAHAEMSIKDIAARTGFYSSNVFIKTFKKWEGVTPGTYKKMINSSPETQTDHPAGKSDGKVSI